MVAAEPQSITSTSPTAADFPTGIDCMTVPLPAYTSELAQFCVIVDIVPVWAISLALPGGLDLPIIRAWRKRWGWPPLLLLSKPCTKPFAYNFPVIFSLNAEREEAFADPAVVVVACKVPPVVELSQLM